LTVVACSHVVYSKDVKICCVANRTVGTIRGNKVVGRHMDDVDAEPALVFVSRLCRLVESEIDHRRSWWRLSRCHDSWGSNGCSGKESHGDGGNKSGEGNHFAWF
jgi:hypothetical protein